MKRRRSQLILWLVVAFALEPVLAQSQVYVPFQIPTAKGWRTETIPPPLDFAPEVDFQGLEELRFAPGMFDAQAVDFSVRLEPVDKVETSQAPVSSDMEAPGRHSPGLSLRKVTGLNSTGSW